MTTNSHSRTEVNGEVQTEPPRRWPWVVRIPNEVLHDRRLSQKGVLTYVALQSFNDHSGRVKLSINSISRVARLCPRSVQRGLEELKAVGLVYVISGKSIGHVNTYLIYDRSPDSDEVGHA